MKHIQNCLLQDIELLKEPRTVDLPKRDRILKYYDIAGPDYEAWSPSFNMHFGYYKKGFSFFNLEKMLNQMNVEVLERLHLPNASPAVLADMGCGLGATARYAAKMYEQVEAIGITIVQSQVDQATAITKAAGLQDKVRVIKGDYAHSPLKDNSIDGTYAIECSCYASGSSKSDLLKEMHRVLKPGSKMVIADGLLKKVPKDGLIGMAYDTLCHCWAFDEMGQVEHIRQAMKEIGYRDIQMEEISLRVAPSVAYVPIQVIKFLVKTLLSPNSKMVEERWNNLVAPLLTMVVGLSQKHFGYYLVSGKK